MESYNRNTKRTNITQFHLYIALRIVKLIEKENSVVSRDEGKGVTGVIV